MHEPNPIDIAAKASGEPVFREVGVGPWSQTHPGEPRPDDPQSPNFDTRLDSALLDEGDRRNVLDRYRYWSVEAIKDDLDQRGRHGFEVAVENWTHDFNIGSMVRTANAFSARAVHIVGPHKWNRKGSLMTELYQHVFNHPSISELVSTWRQSHPQGRVIALDIVDGAQPIERYEFPETCLMLFGAEGPGLSQKALELADDVVYISQFGSVRSINAGAAAAVAMHCWIAQHAA
ncbi:TrmH family RNA methyltransferase [Bifidobacterium tsurumiense]|uniref:rRNA methylase n=1 Tax=Bifidobacterium tsurumiense TaxID=356829 RepID=A0A087EI00_9BIFI|nr:TrmH family RNA methyltransferase [Bifidobacterium tsurumiense]KFJ07401.1 rRNA methylase [Bifidobacterium tsurumiense]MDY4677400.1 TrmH family RNA methyltransferase [Bifidobacterium tsurumiense]MSS13165.1 RNA methyltransferase [Bifidobacterium tsurumiense]